ncbi:MAG: elongation factor P [Patescibacteria group bacterium]|nr:elongation factor P [Patescibacteria group bacterium]
MMLNQGDIKVGVLVQISNEPYVVIKTDHNKTAQRRAVLKTKLKNLVNGSILEKSFQQGEKIEEAETETKVANYQYKTETEACFMNNETFEQFNLPLEQVGDKLKFLKEGTDVNILFFQSQPVSLRLPIKIAIRVVSAPPGVKGNSAGNVTKTVELETGAQINVPMFINEGDTIIINTDDGEYVGREQ